MKRLKLALGLVLVPLCAWIGSLVPIGTGSGIIIGLVLGIVLSYLFFTYGPGHNKSQFPISYYLNHRHQVNSGANQQAIDNDTEGARTAARPNLEGLFPRR